MKAETGFLSPARQASLPRDGHENSPVTHRSEMRRNVLFTVYCSHAAAAMLKWGAPQTQTSGALHTVAARACTLQLEKAHTARPRWLARVAIEGVCEGF